MSQEKEDWIDGVLKSMEGAERAQPTADLFVKIKEELNLQDAKLISMTTRRIAAAAAIILLLINVFALHEYSQNFNSNNSELMIEESEIENSLISNFNFHN